MTNFGMVNMYGEWRVLESATSLHIAQMCHTVFQCRLSSCNSE